MPTVELRDWWVWFNRDIPEQLSRATAWGTTDLGVEVQTGTICEVIDDRIFRTLDATYCLVGEPLRPELAENDFDEDDPLGYVAKCLAAQHELEESA